MEEGIVYLEQPMNVQKQLNVDISYVGNGECIKNLVKFSSDGRILSKKYREGLIDRNFEGYLEEILKKY